MTHQPITNSDHREADLLKEVRLKEEAIEKSLTEARDKASQQLEEARIASVALIQKAQSQAMDETQKYSEARRKGIGSLTEVIVSEAQPRASQIQKEAQKNREEAVRLILNHIFPTHKEKSSIAVEVSS